jgi:HAE1 family hydrophobic/amphiphilic exporter-1
MNLIASFIRNPVKISVGVLLVAMFGVISLTRMPMQLTPEVQTPTISIETRWPGASPQEIEREIIHEQEEQLKGVEGVTKMTSDCNDSFGTITLEFSVGTNMSEALLMVNTRLQQVREYPEDADEPVLTTANSDDRPIAWFVLGQRSTSEGDLREFARQHPATAAEVDRIIKTENEGLKLHHLRNLAKEYPPAAALLPEPVDIPTLRKFAEDNLETQFERVDGVSNANVFGGREEELQVVVNPQKLAARRLTITDVRVALRGQNVDTSAGDFWEGKRRYVVRTLGQFRSPQQVEEVIIARRDGAPVYVRDVAEVRLDYKKPDGLVRRFGGSSIAVNVQRKTGANVLDVMDGLRQANRDLNEGILAQRDLKLTQVYDETEYIYSSVELVRNNIYIGGLLTVATLLLFLRSGRSTLVIGLAIPTSLVGSFIVLGVMGRSLNVISLAGLAFAVGMLVDNAIVVLENIYRHYQLGEDRVTAAVNGTREVWGAVLSSTLTTLAVFLPVLFVEEEAGQLFRDIAIAISAGVGLSLIVSISVIPTATAGILRERHAAHDRARPRASRGIWARFLSLVDAFGKGFVDMVVGINRWLQAGISRRAGAVTLLVAASLGVSYALVPAVEYLPQGNRNLVFGILLPPPGYNLDQLMAIGETIEERMRPYWDVVPGDPGNDQLRYPVIGDFFYVARGRSIFMGLRAEDPLRAAELVALIQEVASDVPGTFAVAKQSSLFEQGLSGGRTVDIEITGPDLEKLIAIGSRVLGQVRTVVPGAQAIPKPSLDLSSPEVHIIPKWEQAADMGITAADLGYAVDALVDGAYASDYYVGGDKIDLSIIGQTAYASRTQDLAALTISTPSGDLIPLSAVADVVLGSGPEQINHRERLRAVTIEVSPPLETPLELAMNDIDEQIIAPIRRSGELGGVYQINLAGTVDKLRSTWRALRFNFILALLITYLLMAALFESWIYPFVIILSVPLGAVGAFMGLALLNVFVLQPLDVLTMLGFVILIGTVVNNPILIVHQALNHMREDQMSRRDAVLESIRTRIRPIFMTTSTTILGLLPLVLFPGAGSELYRGLGSVVLGGLLVSTIFTLVLVPCLFTLFLDAQAWLLGRVEAAGNLTALPAGAAPAAAPRSPDGL